MAASYTPSPGVPGSAFRGAHSTHSAFACGQLGCPLLKLALRIIHACLQIPSCLHKHGVLQEKSSVFAHLILCASDELWVFFQSIHGEREASCLKPGLPIEAKEVEQAGELSPGESGQLIFPWTSALGGERGTHYLEISIWLSWGFF